MTRSRACTLALLSILVWAIAGCGSHSGDGRGAQAPSGAGTVVSDTDLADLAPGLREAASWARAVTYRSRSGVDDGGTRVTGSVFVPHGTPPAVGFPLVALAPTVWGAGCAASASPDLLGNADAAAALLKLGYVVFVPDCQGFVGPVIDNADPSTRSAYLDSTTAGYVVIDGVRAAKSIAPTQTSNRWAALGSADGGQAAWAANELVDNHGSGLQLVVTAALAPWTDFAGLADAAMAGTLTTEQKLAYVAFLAAVKSEHEYDVNLDTYRRGEAERD